MIRKLDNSSGVEYLQSSLALEDAVELVKGFNPNQIIVNGEVVFFDSMTAIEGAALVMNVLGNYISSHKGKKFIVSNIDITPEYLTRSKVNIVGEWVCQ